ncbi:MAG: DNA repair protein RadC [Rickettsiaceae bacterium]|nr:DNA repair protein RadC [Rickettsiaceae bacterium]
MKDLNNYSTGHRKRLKNRFKKSPTALEDYELLELILFNAIPRKDVKTIAKILIEETKDFSNVVNLDFAKLTSISMERNISIPESVEIQFLLIQEAIRRCLRGEIKNTEIISRSSELNNYLIATMSGKEVENFRVLYLNTKNHLIADEVQESGTIDQVHIYPREILKRAIYHGAASMILVHNHPSGVCSPSKADISLTNQIIQVCSTLDISVHDHIIVGGKNVFSFRANGIL